MNILKMDLLGCPDGSVKCLTLDFGSGHDLRVVRLSPVLGMEPSQAGLVPRLPDGRKLLVLYE